MADVQKLREDVKYWTDEIRIRREKAEKYRADLTEADRSVREAVATLSERTRQLGDAERQEARKQEAA